MNFDKIYARKKEILLWTHCSSIRNIVANLWTKLLFVKCFTLHVLICHCYCLHCTACNKINTFLCRYMMQKLFAFAKGKCCAESCDNPMFQEVLLAGHLYQNVLKVHRCCVIDSCDFVFLVAFSNCSSDTFCCRLIVVTFGFCRAMLCIIAAYASCGVCMCVCHVCGSCQNE